MRTEIRENALDLDLDGVVRPSVKILKELKDIAKSPADCAQQVGFLFSKSAWPSYYN